MLPKKTLIMLFFLLASAVLLSGCGKKAENAEPLIKRNEKATGMQVLPAEEAPTGTSGTAAE
jgi:hypothetical protein